MLKNSQDRQTAAIHRETKQGMELGIGNRNVPTFKRRRKTDNEIEGNPVGNEQPRGKNIQH